jgi:uncharacterized protein (TIGR00369 family)
MDQSRLEAFSAQQPVFSKLLGAKMIHASTEKLEAEMFVREDLTNPRGILQGGALMALADNLGGAATFINLPEGAATTTIESKTNFFSAVPLGETVRAECTPLHRGRTTMVWETRIFRHDGKLAAVVTQTQLVMTPQA